LEHGATPISEAEGIRSEGAARDLSYVDQNWGDAGKFGMGLASGVTLGLGPGVAARLGYVDPGHVQAAQTSPFYTAGDIAGTILPALATGGESAGLSGLARLSPAGLLDVAGSGTERLVGGLLGEGTGVLGRLWSKPLQMAARGAVEGSAINLGHTLGDSLLDNKPLSAQALLAASQDGALFGAFLGGSLGTVGSIGSQAVESLGGLGRKVLGGKIGEGAVARRLGASAEDLTELSEGGTRSVSDTYKVLNETLEKGGTGAKIGSADSTLQEGIKAGKAAWQAERIAAVKALDESAPQFSPSLDRINNRLDTEIAAPKVGTFLEQHTLSGLAKVKEQLSSLGERPTWSKWVESRDQIASKVSGELKTQVLSVVDSEIRSAMEGAELTGEHLKGIADKYSAASAGEMVAKSFEDSLGKKMTNKLLSSEPSINPKDLAYAIGGSILGHPAASISWLAGKGIIKNLGARVEPAMAQMAFDMSVGQKAAAATNTVRSQIKDSVKAFLGSGTKAVNASYKPSEKATVPKDVLTRKSFEDKYSRAEQMLSDGHQAKVRKYTEMLYSQGYPELASQLQDTNSRAIQYLTYNMPARQSAKAVHSLRQIPVSKVPTLKEYQFDRQMNIIQKPMSLLKGLENGSISRDEVAAVKYVYPDLHRELVATATEEIYQMKLAGKHLPMGKIGLLSVAMDAPLDSAWTPEYIGAVQASFMKKPQPQAQNQSQPVSQPMSNQATNLMTVTERLSV
jgi:hypothetical protein